MDNKIIVLSEGLNQNQIILRLYFLIKKELLLYGT